MILNGWGLESAVVAGAVIAAVTWTLQGVANRALGVSTGLEEVCGRFSRLPYFGRPELTEKWRLVMLAGLLCGGALAGLTGGGWHLNWTAGMLDTRLHLTDLQKVLWFWAGGLLIGLGTRLAGGDSLGHGVYGLARGQRGSVVTTIVFLTSGILTANLLWVVLVRK